MSRVFLSHSSRDNRQAAAVKKWLVEQEPGLAEEIYLDLDPHTGIRPAERRNDHHLAALTGIRSGRIKSLLGMLPASDTAAAATPAGGARRAMPWSTGRR